MQAQTSKHGISTIKILILNYNLVTGSVYYLLLLKKLRRVIQHATKIFLGNWRCSHVILVRQSFIILNLLDIIWTNAASNPLKVVQAFHVKCLMSTSLQHETKSMECRGILASKNPATTPPQKNPQPHHIFCHLTRHLFKYLPAHSFNSLLYDAISTVLRGRNTKSGLSCRNYQACRKFNKLLFEHIYIKKKKGLISLVSFES